jgi:hypothetical protein
MSDTWKQVATSPLMSLYSHELYWLAADVDNRARAIMERMRPPRDPDQSYIKVEPELHADIYAMLGSAAKIRALVTERPRRRNQSLKAHQLLCQRSRALKKLLQNIELEAILSSEARNSLEHFDERIDETAEAIVNGKTEFPVHILLDIAAWDRRALETLKGSQTNPELVLLRAYIADEHLFINLSHEIDLAQLHREAQKICGRLQPLIGPTEEGRGAQVVVVTEQTFEAP